jgi:hypothetical protein
MPVTCRPEKAARFVWQVLFGRFCFYVPAVFSVLVIDAQCARRGRLNFQ